VQIRAPFQIACTGLIVCRAQTLRPVCPSRRRTCAYSGRGSQSVVVVFVGTAISLRATAWGKEELAWRLSEVRPWITARRHRWGRSTPVAMLKLTPRAPFTGTRGGPVTAHLPRRSLVRGHHTGHPGADPWGHGHGRCVTNGRHSSGYGCVPSCRAP